MSLPTCASGTSRTRWAAITLCWCARPQVAEPGWLRALLGVQWQILPHRKASLHTNTAAPLILPSRTALRPARSMKVTGQQPTERLRKRSCWLASGQRQQRSSGEDVSAPLLL